MASQQPHSRLNIHDVYAGSPYSSHSPGSSGRSSMNSMESQSSRHYNAQEQGNGSYLQHDRTPPLSHGSGGGGQPMSGHGQTSVVSGYGSSGHRGGGGSGTGSVKLPPSMLHR